MIFFHCGRIDEDYFKALVSHVNALSEDETLYHYIESEGGYYSTACTALDLLHSLGKRAVYIATGTMFSSAFHMFFKFKGEKRLIEGTVGGIHQRYREVTMNSNGKLRNPNPNVNTWMKDDKENLEEDLDFFSGLGLTEQQIKSFRAGKDVPLTYREIDSLFQKQIKNVKSSRTTRKTKTAAIKATSKRGSRKI